MYFKIIFVSIVYYNFNHFHFLQIFFSDCTLQFTARYRLVDHIKSHTQEKSCACPNCGIMFATYTKLKDHCRKSNKGELKNKCYQHIIIFEIIFQTIAINVNFVKKHFHVKDF